MLNISFQRMAMYRKQKFEIQANLGTTMVTIRKWQGDHYIQGDRYIQVNSAENIRQLKILRSCPVTVMGYTGPLYTGLTVAFGFKRGTTSSTFTRHFFCSPLLFGWTSTGFHFGGICLSGNF